jgi:hypothetical protein
MNEYYFIGLASEESTNLTFFLFVYTNQGEKNKEGKRRHHNFKESIILAR